MALWRALTCSWQHFLPEPINYTAASRCSAAQPDVKSLVEQIQIGVQKIFIITCGHGRCAGHFPARWESAKVCLPCHCGNWHAQSKWVGLFLGMPSSISSTPPGPQWAPVGEGNNSNSSRAQWSQLSPRQWFCGRPWPSMERLGWNCGPGMLGTSWDQDEHPRHVRSMAYARKLGSKAWPKQWQDISTAGTNVNR